MLLRMEDTCRMADYALQQRYHVPTNKQMQAHNGGHITQVMCSVKQHDGVQKLTHCIPVPPP